MFQEGLFGAELPMNEDAEALAACGDQALLEATLEFNISLLDDGRTEFATQKSIWSWVLESDEHEAFGFPRCARAVDCSPTVLRQTLVERFRGQLKLLYGQCALEDILKMVDCPIDQLSGQQLIAMTAPKTRSVLAEVAA